MPAINILIITQTIRCRQHCNTFHVLLIQLQLLWKAVAGGFKSIWNWLWIFINHMNIQGRVMHNRLLITVSMGSILVQELLYRINFLLALNTSFVPPCTWVSLPCLKTLQGEIPLMRPGFRDTPGTEMNLPSIKSVPAKMLPYTTEWCLGRSANSFSLYSVFPSARCIKQANPTTA